jgi:hypothetical protein
MPPLRLISRLIVDGARSRFLAMVRIESPATIEREISSRSASVNVVLDRMRGGGRIPPLSQNALDRRMVSIE